MKPYQSHPSSVSVSARLRRHRIVIALLAASLGASAACDSDSDDNQDSQETLASTTSSATTSTVNDQSSGESTSDTATSLSDSSVATSSNVDVSNTVDPTTTLSSTFDTNSNSDASSSTQDSESTSSDATVSICVEQGGSCAHSESCCGGLTCCEGIPIEPGKEFCGTICPESDRNLKEGLAQVDGAVVLQKLIDLPIHYWSYRTQPGVRHLGPMAQDFKANFELGDSDRGIYKVDADGVAFAAIQALHQQMQRLAQENAQLNRRLVAAESQLKAMQGADKFSESQSRLESRIRAK